MASPPIQAQLPSTMAPLGVGECVSTDINTIDLNYDSLANDIAINRSLTELSHKNFMIGLNKLSKLIKSSQDTTPSHDSSREADGQLPDEANGEARSTDEFDIRAIL